MWSGKTRRRVQPTAPSGTDRRQRSWRQGGSKTAGEEGEVRIMQTPKPTAEVPEGSGAETGPGGAADGRGATLDATAMEVDVAGAGGCHRAEKQKRETVAGWREKSAGKNLWSWRWRGEDQELWSGGKPRGGVSREWEGGRVAKRHHTPRVEALPQGMKPPE